MLRVFGEVRGKASRQSFLEERNPELRPWEVFSKQKGRRGGKVFSTEGISHVMSKSKTLPYGNYKQFDV